MVRGSKGQIGRNSPIRRVMRGVHVQRGREEFGRRTYEIPAPTSRSRLDFSKMVMSRPSPRRAMAHVRPPIPPPTCLFPRTRKGRVSSEVEAFVQHTAVSLA